MANSIIYVYYYYYYPAIKAESRPEEKDEAEAGMKKSLRQHQQ